MFASNILANPKRLLLLVLLATAALLTGCSDDDTTSPTGEQPQAEVAASLTQPTQTVAAVHENLAQLEQFENPLSSLAADAGLIDDTDIDGWTGEGMSFPDQTGALAAAARELHNVEMRSLALAKSKALPRDLAMTIQKADGDTLAVEYFDGPDSTGLNALVMVTEPDLIKFVVQRYYPVRLGFPVRREQEIVIDTNGTLEDDADDLYHSATHEVEMAGGEIAYGSLAPFSGTGPMEAGVPVLAHSRVENPRWHILQAWNEADIVLDPGDFRTEGDEIIHSFDLTVHWRNDAEYTASLTPVEGGAIEIDSTVRATAFLTAAPADGWLESIADTLYAQMGDLDEEDDDLLLEMSRGAVFDGTASDGGNPRHYLHFLPDEPVVPGEEPCGGQAEQDVWYPAAWWLVHLHRDADIDCDGSGTLHELQELRDGSSFERTITWDGAGEATITENRLNGTQVTGTFNENTGEYDIVTTFANGGDPVSRHQTGQALESNLEAYDVLTWQDAHADSTFFSAVESGSETTVSGWRHEYDVREDFTVTETDDGHVTGSWSRNDGAEGEFTLEPLEGGSSHLTFSASDPAAEGSPSVDGELWLAPDGSGTGTVTFTQFGITVTYDVTFGPDGTGGLDDGGGELVPF